MINIEEIAYRYCRHTAIENGETYYEKERVHKAIRESCKMVLDEAAERAEINYTGFDKRETKYLEVDKQSILKIKEEL